MLEFVCVPSSPSRVVMYMSPGFTTQASGGAFVSVLVIGLPPNSTVSVTTRLVAVFSSEAAQPQTQSPSGHLSCIQSPQSPRQRNTGRIQDMHSLWGLLGLIRGRRKDQRPHSPGMKTRAGGISPGGGEGSVGWSVVHTLKGGGFDS